MRKYLFALIALIASAGAFSASAQMRWGATVGLDLTNLKWNQDKFRSDPFESTKSLGYLAGITGEYEIPGIGFGIEIGLQYVQRGATLGLGDFLVWSSDGFGRERNYLHYLDIPFHLRFKYQNLNGFERKLAPLVYAGPTMSILLAHNLDVPFEYKAVHLGLEVGVGAEIFRDYQLTIGYNWDVTGSTKAVKLDNFNSHNRTWKFALTYFF